MRFFIKNSFRKFQFVGLTPEMDNGQWIMDNGGILLRKMIQIIGSADTFIVNCQLSTVHYLSILRIDKLEFANFSLCIIPNFSGKVNCMFSHFVGILSFGRQNPWEVEIFKKYFVKTLVKLPETGYSLTAKEKEGMILL
jgi:hypothetical protein